MTDSTDGNLTLEGWQVEQLKRIADLIRGDWSGSIFDGREVQDWILQTLNGANLNDEFDEIDTEYWSK